MGVKVLCWNAHSISNKFTEIVSLVTNLSIDILLISETWLKAEDNYQIPGFSSFRADRFRGGTAIFIRFSIPHRGFSKIQLSYAESCSLIIDSDDQPVRISSIYCSPSASRSQSKTFFDQVLSQPGPHIVAGDFNCKHIQWNNSSCDRKGSDLLDNLNHMLYTIFPPEEPTLYPYNGEPSCVDFVVSKNLNSIGRVEVLNDLSSDHLPLLFHVDESISRDSSQPLNLAKANWRKFRRLVDIDCLDFDFSSLGSSNSIDEAVQSFSSTICKNLTSVAPKMKTLCVRYRYSQEVEFLIKNRNRFRHLYKRNRDPSFKSSVNQLNRLIRQKVRVEKFDQFHERLKSLSHKDLSLFQFTKSLKRKRRSVPPLIDSVGTHYSDKEKVEAFARSFEACFNVSLNSSSKHEHAVQESIRSLSTKDSDDLVPLSDSEVVDVLKSLHSRKSPGFDEIPNIALSALTKSPLVISLLTGLFNCCLKLSYFPNDWKIAKIIPIPKNRHLSNVPDQFRPISLLSCLGKCFEKLILRRLNDFEQENNVFISQQCGFRAQHSTIHQVLRITENISFGFNKNKSTAMVLLDLRKAFDSVWHDGLVHKLINFKYPTYLTKLVQSYLVDRRASVSLNGSQSSTFKVQSGVPQGSLIAPHLFNIFVNDIPKFSHGNLALYADDTAFSVEVPWKSLKSAKKKLVAAVEKLQEFFSSWKIFLNESKTEFIIFSKSTKMIQLLHTDTVSFNNQEFNWSKSVKYLGVTLDCKLLLKDHIEQSIKKASLLCFKTLYCLINRKSPVPLDIKLRIYKIYVRPTLSYACQVFANCAKSHLNKLQKFENKILRMIHNVHWSDFMSTSELHETCRIPLLTDHIAKLTDNFYKKSISHPSNIFNKLGQYNKDSLGFRVKHRLPRAI